MVSVRKLPVALDLIPQQIGWANSAALTNCKLVSLCAAPANRVLLTVGKRSMDFVTLAITLLVLVFSRLPTLAKLSLVGLLVGWQWAGLELHYEQQRQQAMLQGQYAQSVR